MKKLIALVAVLGLTACSDAPTAERVLSDQGFTNIRTSGYAWWGCDKEDTFKTGFTAIGPAGKPVSGVVCSGWLKGATVRFN
jgi:hypothetical protein